MKDLELIERFTDLSLSDDELLEFEQRLENNPEFVKKFKNYQESIELVEKKYSSASDKARIVKWKKTISQEDDTNANTLPWKWITGIAASVVFVFFGWQYINNLQEQDLAVMVQDSWDKKIGLDYHMMRTVNRDSLQKVIVSAFDAYEEKKYKEAISILAPFTPTTSYYEDALLIKGLSQYRSGNTNNGLETLKILSKFPSGKKAKVALWYQGLIYLDLGDKKAAKKFVQLPTNGVSKIKLKE